ncbi:MAG: transcription antitermination factor NusB [Candidatus Paceibacterota bacterium]
MANRHLSRSIALQTLFEWDFRDWPEKEISPALERNANEFAPGMNEDNRFMHDLLAGVLRKRDVLDEIIEKAAPDWPLDKIANVDRNILRIGLYELLFADRSEVPPKVAINEAIELAKSFGGESSGRFINGVLGSVYREMGEPGKDQTSKKKIKDIPYEEMPIKELGGAVVYGRKDGDIYLALVHDIFGHWTLPKGQVEEGEEVKKTAKRKVKEELGIDSIKIIAPLDENEYIANNPEEGKIRKQVTYFLAETDYQELELPEDKGGLDDVRWFELSEIVNLNFYDDILPIVTKAVQILLGDEKKEK